ncbi:MAG: 4Fe-4S binding protein [Ornithinimicrobium sp.]|uniref:4Fe-4S binding protein n=1 Tax=Ornithinimicrobium sp. TaxID=1977084 RepID=UPI0026E0EBD7|nr:4Fe-4S binding protein [Ornithinimicrobium sp.]MDO5741154.1 4Fe-4S binding protein [Ornithinimicrobium sp.]
MKGLLKGLATTAKMLARRSHTAQYPHTEPVLPERSRGVVALLEDNCTSCMLCARECPSWCIYIDSHKEETPPETEGGRARSHNVLDQFDIDFSLCMYCGICIEVCPFDALFWAPDYAYAEGDIRNLLHGKERLGTWMKNVPESTWPKNYSGYVEAPTPSVAAEQDGVQAQPSTRESTPPEAHQPQARQPEAGETGAGEG